MSVAAKKAIVNGLEKLFQVMMIRMTIINQKKRTNRSYNELKSQHIPKSESKRTRETISSDDEEQPKRKRLEKKVEEKPIKSNDRLSIKRAWMAYLSEERNSATTSK